MTQHARDLTVLDGGLDGSATNPKITIAEPIEEPLRNLEKWLVAGQLADLANVTDRAARKAIKARKWRGVELIVQEVQTGRGGAGGKALQVHVDSLPSDLREAWYLQHGMQLNAAPKSSTVHAVEIAPELMKNDDIWDREATMAQFKLAVIRPILDTPERSKMRSAAVNAVDGTMLEWPDGRRKVITRATL